MHDGKYRVATIHKDRKIRGNHFARRKPAAADYPNDAEAVRLRRLENIHGQSDTEFVPVDNVLGAFESRSVSVDEKARKKKGQGNASFDHIENDRSVIGEPIEKHIGE
jgi:hypothetical protein